MAAASTAHAIAQGIGWDQLVTFCLVRLTNATMALASISHAHVMLIGLLPIVIRSPVSVLCATTKVSATMVLAAVLWDGRGLTAIFGLALGSAVIIMAHASMGRVPVTGVGYSLIVPFTPVWV